MLKRLSIFFILLLALPIAIAASAHLGIDKVVSETAISPLGEASFQINIENKQSSEDIFMLELPDVAWSLRTKNTPDFTTGIALGGYESTNTTVYMKPSDKVAPGTHYVELRARSRATNEYISEIFIVTVDPKIIDYSVDISADVLEPTSIDPSKTNSVKVVLKNPYPVYMSNLSVQAVSKFLNKNPTIDLPPNSDKVLDFSLNIDSSTPKQEDLLIVTVKQNDREIAKISKTLYIKEFRLPYKEERTTTKEFLAVVHKIIFTNTEGTQKTQDASTLKPKTWAILRTSPAANTLEFDGKQYLVWSGVSLNPNETYSVVIIEDMKPIAAGILLLLLLVIVYYQIRSPVIVHKKAYALHKKDTGNNEMKIVLHVKNITGRTLEKVRVLDRLPLIHKVDPDFGEGTPEPRFRKHGAEGVILDWDIALAPYEERIFVYKVKSALPIVGEYILKPCVVQYGKKNRRTSSPSYRLTID